MSSVSGLCCPCPVYLASISFEVPAVDVIDIAIAVVIYSFLPVLFQQICPHVVCKILMSIFYRTVKNGYNNVVVSADFEPFPYILHSYVGAFDCCGSDSLVAGVDHVPLVNQSVVIERQI